MGAADGARDSVDPARPILVYASVFTSVVSVLYLGVLLLVLGVFEIVAAFRKRHGQPFFVLLPSWIGASRRGLASRTRLAALSIA